MFRHLHSHVSVYRQEKHYSVSRDIVFIWHLELWMLDEYLLCRIFAHLIKYNLQLRVDKFYNG